MAWRPSKNVVDGVIDNTVPGRVTGWVRFAGLGVVRLDLTGDCAGELRGQKLQLTGEGLRPEQTIIGDMPTGPHRPPDFFKRFATIQTGHVGTIDRSPDPRGVYLEWYSNKNGRVVLELVSRHCSILA